ncbi:MAG: hypothetical protein ICV70_08035 [Jiangellaceae bacterium]|nr:hypothetical protein [Jiangellaceae bacterium]
MGLFARLGEIRRGEDRGSSATEWVIVTAVLLVVAGGVGLLIYTLLTDQGEVVTPPTIPERP